MIQINAAARQRQKWGMASRRSNSCRDRHHRSQRGCARRRPIVRLVKRGRQDEQITDVRLRNHPPCAIVISGKRYVERKSKEEIVAISRTLARRSLGRVSRLKSTLHRIRPDRVRSRDPEAGV